MIYYAQLESVKKRISHQDYLLNFSLPIELKDQATELFANTDMWFKIEQVPQEMNAEINAKLSKIGVEVENDAKEKKASISKLYAILRDLLKNDEQKIDGVIKTIKEKYNFASFSDLGPNQINVICDRLKNPEMVSEEYVHSIINPL